MATSWHSYNSGDVTSPSSYSQFLSIPSFTTGSSTLLFIFTETQIISGVIRPVITGLFVTEIQNAINTSTSTTDVYVANP